MPTVSQSGLFTLQVLTPTGVPAANYRIYTYDAGTTTHKIAYTDSAGATAHTYTSDGIGGQYIALNARGELPAPLWLQAGAYDIRLADPLNASVWTRRARGTLSLGDVGWFAAGTAAAPGIAFDGDTNTGIYSPGADQLAVSAGGAQRMSVAADGSVSVNGLLSAATFSTTGDATFGGNVSSAANKKLVSGGTSVQPIKELLGAGTLTTNIPYGTGQAYGGGLLIVSGVDIAGDAFCATYAVALRLSGGSSPNGAAVLMDRAGSASPTLTVNANNSGNGFLTITVGANANLTYAYGIGF